jgi:hypothetical protein
MIELITSMNTRLSDCYCEVGFGIRGVKKKIRVYPPLRSTIAFFCTPLQIIKERHRRISVNWKPRSSSWEYIRTALYFFAFIFPRTRGPREDKYKKMQVEYY